MFQRVDPSLTPAYWAFRFCGHFPKVLTVLSGMTYMEHLQENIRTYSPLQPLSEENLAMLDRAANIIAEFPEIGCTRCQYCMPCPYGLNIPGIFHHYNKCINEGTFADSTQADDYKQNRRAFLIGYDRSVTFAPRASATCSLALRTAFAAFIPSEYILDALPYCSVK